MAAVSALSVFAFYERIFLRITEHWESYFLKVQFETNLVKQIKSKSQLFPVAFQAKLLLIDLIEQRQIVIGRVQVWATVGAVAELVVVRRAAVARCREVIFFFEYFFQLET